jgi:DNA-binding response OmpR family regulator/two-component sensor histidine kinase
LNIAEKNAGRLNELITQMLSISKIDAATYQLNENYGDLDIYLSDLSLQYAEQAKQTGLNFSTQIDCLSDLTLFDKDALDKILGNLLSNAIKYTASGGSVGIEATCTTAQEGVIAKISVWDNGLGISKNDQAKIFDRFYRSADQHRGNIKGVGIGLSLAMELVKLMNGKIDVMSEPGNGSVFTVTLPLKLKPTVTNTEAPTAIDKCILIVEDDADILDFNRRLLQEQGFEVTTAVNGEEALKAVAQKLPDLIITDLMMPIKDGFALLADIRADDITKEIPVVILSSKSAAGSRITALEGGAQVYLPKPFLPDELVATVKSQLLVSQRRTEPTGETAEVKLSLEEQIQKADPFAKKCYAIVQEHINDSELTVEFLADRMHVNRSHFQRKLKASAGYSPNELIRAVRLEKAHAMLQAREGNISEIAYSTGFTSPSYFGKCYTDYFGHPPSKHAA